MKGRHQRRIDFTTDKLASNYDADGTTRAQRKNINRIVHHTSIYGKNRSSLMSLPRPIIQLI